MGVERSLAVDEPEDVADDRRMRTVPDFLDVQLVGDTIGLRVDFATALQLEGLLRQRLEPPTIDTCGVTECGQVERHCLDAGFDHEVARHTRVVFEMPVEESRIVGDRRLATHEATPPWPTGRVELGDLVDEELLACLNLRRARVCLGPLET